MGRVLRDKLSWDTIYGQTPYTTSNGICIAMAWEFVVLVNGAQGLFRLVNGAQGSG